MQPICISSSFVPNPYFWGVERCWRLEGEAGKPWETKGGGDVGGESGKSYKRGEDGEDGDGGEEEERSPSV